LLDGRLLPDGASTLAGNKRNRRRDAHIGETDCLGQRACFDLIGSNPASVDPPASLAAVVPQSSDQVVKAASPPRCVFPGLPPQTEMQRASGRLDDLQ
jgi:hypothetical protein